MERKGENKTVAKETKQAICMSDGKKVSITHMCINVPGRPSDPTFLRLDSWDCDESQNCKNIDCVGKIRNGKIKGWV